MNRKHFLQRVVPATVGSLLVKGVIARHHSDPVELPGVLKMPPYLKPGDTIGITCPAGAMKASDLKLCKDAIESWGFKTKYGNTVDKSWQRFGGTDDQRAADFQAMLEDSSIQAIMFGRGGYGVMRMMDKIDWTSFSKQPKWLVGFSDITAFHCHIHSQYGIPTIHGDMGNGFNGTDDAAAKSLRNVLLGNKQEHICKGFELNRPGKSTAKLIGGNLSLMVAVQGSKSALKTDGKILLVEDVSEYRYSIDRMMTNLKRSGMLDNLAGIVFGGFTEIKVDDHDYTIRLEEILYEKVKEYNYPVAFHFPAGHQRENMALKLGTYYSLEVSVTGCKLAEVATPMSTMPVGIMDSTFMKPDTGKAIIDSLR